MHQVLAVENIEKPVKRGRQAVELGISGFLSTIQRACPILGRIPPFLNNYNTPNQTHRTESSKHSLATKHQAAYVTDLNQPITMPDAIMCFQTRTDCFSSKTQSCKIQTGWILEQCESKQSGRWWSWWSWTEGAKVASLRFTLLSGNFTDAVLAINKEIRPHLCH